MSSRLEFDEHVERRCSVQSKLLHDLLQNWSGRVFLEVFEDVLSNVLLEILRPIWCGHDGVAYATIRLGRLTGARFFSISALECSSQGGSARRVPKFSGDSSIANPGWSVATSKRTPPCSRKYMEWK